MSAPLRRCDVCRVEKRPTSRSYGTTDGALRSTCVICERAHQRAASPVWLRARHESEARKAAARAARRVVAHREDLLVCRGPCGRSLPRCEGRFRRSGTHGGWCGDCYEAQVAAARMRAREERAAVAAEVAAACRSRRAERRSQARLVSEEERAARRLELLAGPLRADRCQVRGCEQACADGIHRRWCEAHDPAGRQGYPRMSIDDFGGWTSRGSRTGL